MARDTDADWTRIAEHQPFFGVLAEDRYRSERLDDAARERFYASGGPDVDFAIATIRRLFDPGFQPRLAVDFGCGVGRLTLAMRAHAERVIGVDVAPGMREIATEEAARRGVDGVEFAAVAPTEGVDWLNSLIVFQHIPPERGYGLIEGLAAAVVPGGAVSLQITTHRDERHLTEIFRDVGLARFDGTTMDVLAPRDDEQVGAMTMYDYDLGRVLAVLGRLGFGRFWLDHTDHAGVHGYWIFSQRAGGPDG